MLPVPTSTYQLSPLEGFVGGAFGACVAVTFTNPMDVAKTRLQLDGELRAKGSLKAYSNTLDVLRKTAKAEGILACQKGLGAAYAYQFALNGSRLGFYEPLRRAIGSFSGQDPSRVQLWSSVCAGASSGVIGAILGNPLFLVKARLQAYSSIDNTRIIKDNNNDNNNKKMNSKINSMTKFNSTHPTQHAYKSAIDGLRQIFKAEGYKGLMRGVDAAIMRTAMGSSVQLPAYNYAKTHLAPYFSNDSFGLYIASSSFSGICVLTAMQPADTALTRMYNQSNQPGKRLYKNPIDCLWKTIQIEGFTGLYKGSTAHFFRIAPHTIITLVANEAITQWWSRRMMKS